MQRSAARGRADGRAKGGGMLGDLVVWYLFLGGAGAGLLLAAAVLECLSPQALVVGCGSRYVPQQAYRRFFGPAYLIGVAALSIGMLCLLVDLGRGERVLMLFLQPALSFISVGAFSLLALVVLAAFPVAVWAFGYGRFPRVFVLIVRALLIVVALVVMAYTGLFLSSMPSVPLWATPSLPVLFVASALSSGLALLVCTVVLTGSGEEFSSTLDRLRKVDAVVIACEIVALVVFVASAYAGSETARASAERLVQGDLATLFLGLVVVLGLLVPLACEAFNRTAAARVSVAAGAFVLVGGFFLRWCVSEAGAAVDIAASVMTVLGIQ